MSVSQGPNAVRGFLQQGEIGSAADVGVLNRHRTYANSAPQAKQVTTVTVADPGDDTDVSIVINGVAVTFNTASGLNATEIAAGLATAINAEPLARGSVIASSSGTTLTLTGKTEGVTFTVTESDAALSSVTTTTPATQAEAVPFGRVVLNRGYPENIPANQPRIERDGALAKTQYLTAQVMTLTVATGATGTRTVSIYEIRGDERILIGSNTYAGNATAATEATNIANAINAAVAANTVEAVPATADVVITAEIPGLEFDVEVQGPTGNVVKAFTTGPSLATSLNRGFAGISLYSPNDEARLLGALVGDYGPNREVKVMETGGIWVETSEAITPDSPVYVETADGANSGKLFTTSSATRVALGRGKCQWIRRAYVAGDAQAVVRVNAVRP